MSHENPERLWAFVAAFRHDGEELRAAASKDEAERGRDKLARVATERSPVIEYMRVDVIEREKARAVGQVYAGILERARPDLIEDALRAQTDARRAQEDVVRCWADTFCEEEGRRQSAVGNLDRIRALAETTRKRYLRAVEQLEDVNRWLAGEP